MLGEDEVAGGGSCEEGGCLSDLGNFSSEKVEVFGGQIVVKCANDNAQAFWSGLDCLQRGCGIGFGETLQ